MGLERMGLGGVITADSSGFRREVGRARDEYGRFVKSTDQVISPKISSGFADKIRTMAQGVASGMSRIGQGFNAVALGAMPVALGIGSMFRTAVAFEKQMGVVKAVTFGTNQEIAKLEEQAKQIAVTTSFGAIQAAKAQEELARGGATVEETFNSLKGVMYAAAADEMDVASASTIITNVIKGMGLEFKDATHVADVLALASARTTTNISLLGESFAYGATKAKILGIGLEETAAIFGVLSNAGAKGSMAGTSFGHMLEKMGKPSEKGTKILKKWGLTFTDNTGKLRKFSDIVADVSRNMEGIKTVTERSAILWELFGTRGGRAMNALMSQGKGAMDALQKELEGSSEAFGGTGAAAEMTRRRLDTVWGAVEQIKAAWGLLSIELFKGPLDAMKGPLQDITAGFRGMLFVMMALREAAGGDIKQTKNWQEALKLVGEEGANSALVIVRGLSEAAKSISEGWNSFLSAIKSGSQWLKETFGPDIIGKIVKFAAIFATVVGAATPMIAVLAVVKYLIGGIVQIAIGLGTIISSAFWPLIVGIGIAIVAYRGLKRENESFFAFAVRAWEGIKTWAIDVWENGIKPFGLGLSEWVTPIIETLSSTFFDVSASIKSILMDLFGTIFGWTEGQKTNWQDMGYTMGAVITGTLKLVLGFVADVIRFVARVVKIVRFFVEPTITVIANIVEMVATNIAKVVYAISEMASGNILGGLARLGTALLDFVLQPVQLLVRGIVSLAEAVGIDLPKGVKAFAEEGTTGLIFGSTKQAEDQYSYKTRAEMLAAIPGAEVATKKLVNVPVPAEEGTFVLDPNKAVPFTLLKGGLEQEETIKKFGGMDTGKLNKGVTWELPPEKTPASLIPAVAKPKVVEQLSTSASIDAFYDEFLKRKTEGLAQPQTSQPPTINFTDDRPINVNNNIFLDGKELSKSVARNTQEAHERSGAKVTPAQRRAALEQGAIPMAKAS